MTVRSNVFPQPLNVNDGVPQRSTADSQMPYITEEKNAVAALG